MANKPFPAMSQGPAMRILTIVAVLLLAGCSTPDNTSNDQTLAPTSSTLEPPSNDQTLAPTSSTLEPLNATFSGHFEFAASFESPLLDGCSGHNISSAQTGNVLTLTVPNGYENGTADAVVSSGAPAAGSYRLCLNEEAGTNIATTTGPSPLHLDFTPRQGELYLFLWADNTQTTSPAANADFTLMLEVRA